ncbi:MAG: Rieske 2Fe-2S domain-containing protein [Acidobacteria bacterium]|nr:Rieske 2Fe-2S domain-containing protein [Acidobacteriota bacterium]
MLIPFPLAYLFGSALVNVWARATRRPHWFRTAHHMSRLGIGSAFVAAVPGLIDYIFAVPPRSSGRQRATNHMMANVGAVGLFAAARLGGRDGEAGPSAAALAAELCGAGLLIVGGWHGGTLVYRNQIGVDHRYADAGKWRVDVVAPGLEAPEIDAGPADDLQVGQMKLLRAGQERIVIGRTEQGFVAFDDRCTHRGATLADGALVCDTVQCPWHGSQFDVHTGAVRHGPADQAIQTYPLSVRDGRLWLRRSPV